MTPACFSLFQLVLQCISASAAMLGHTVQCIDGPTDCSSYCAISSVPFVPLSHGYHAGASSAWVLITSVIISVQPITNQSVLT